MVATPVKGFFAYPSTPATTPETIRTAINTINQGGEAALIPWEDLRVGGTVIIKRICDQIARQGHLVYRRALRQSRQWPGKTRGPSVPSSLGGAPYQHAKTGE